MASHGFPKKKTLKQRNNLFGSPAKKARVQDQDPAAAQRSSSPLPSAQHIPCSPSSPSSSGQTSNGFPHANNLLPYFLFPQSLNPALFLTLCCKRACALHAVVRLFSLGVVCSECQITKDTPRQQQLAALGRGFYNGKTVPRAAVHGIPSVY